MARCHHDAGLDRDHLSLDFIRDPSIIGPSRPPASRLFASVGVALGISISPQLAVRHRRQMVETENVTRGIDPRLVRHIQRDLHSRDSRCLCHPHRRWVHEHVGKDCAGRCLSSAVAQLLVSMRCSLTAPTPRIDCGWIVPASKPNGNGVVAKLRHVAYKKASGAYSTGRQVGTFAYHGRAPGLRLRPFGDSQKGEHADTLSLW